MIAAGNIGCITQIAAGTAIPVVHTVELIDWATGGPVPERLGDLAEGSERCRGRLGKRGLAAFERRPVSLSQRG